MVFLLSLQICSILGVGTPWPLGKEGKKTPRNEAGPLLPAFLCAPADTPVPATYLDPVPVKLADLT